MTATRLTHERFFLIALLLALCILSQCSVVPSRGFPIMVYSQTITLAWDPPWGAMASEFSGLQGYNVYYKSHFGGWWMQIASVPIGEPTEVTISRDQIGDGEWDFAVSIMSVSGWESAFHTSLDDSADPVGGWYIIWN